MNKKDLNVLGISTSEIMSVVNYYRSKNLKNELYTAEEILHSRFNLITDLQISYQHTATDNQFNFLYLNDERFSVTTY